MACMLTIQRLYFHEAYVDLINYGMSIIIMMLPLHKIAIVWMTVFFFFLIY